MAELRSAITLHRHGDHAGACARAQAALALAPAAVPILAFLGMLCCEMGDLAAGVTHLGAAHAAEPNDSTILANLVTAHLGADDLVTAERLCTEEAAGRDRSLRLWRLRAYIMQTLSRYPAAIAAYQRVVLAAPNDFESWNNLGNTQLASGDLVAGIAALERAAALQPAFPPIRLNLAAALEQAGDTTDALDVLQTCADVFPSEPQVHDALGCILARLGSSEEAQDAFTRAVMLAPQDVSLLIKLGQQLIETQDFEGAERRFRAALAIDAGLADGYVELATLLEHRNRIDELPALIAAAEVNDVAPGAVKFVQALSHRRKGRFAEGLAAVLDVPETIQPVPRAQVIGQCLDRLGEIDAAFAAFVEMNRLAALDPSSPLARAADYRKAIRADRDLVTPAWHAEWSTVAPSPKRPSPVFLVGFPRSGTTLLDTILMGHERVRILEEQPILRGIEHSIGGFGGLAKLDATEIVALRKRYFDEADQRISLAPGVLIVDKFPLNLNKVPLIHRLFPDARFILVLRHPCDVVLSCFITSFRANSAMANFLDLGTAAEMYDLTFDFWKRAIEIMPVNVHTIRYEDVVTNSEVELRQLFDYLDLTWYPRVLDHQRTAANRGAVRTASYAQVTEPLYERAAGRWRRYEQHLAPVIPILAPWVERLGYAF